MLFKMTEVKYQPNPKLERALDVLFILHADHEQNCSTSAMRAIGSSNVDPFSALAGAAAALYGPLHGGANEAVLRMLKEIGSVENIPAFIKKVKAGEGRLMGFGHRVYKSYDPRAKIIKRTAYEVFEVTGKNPLLDIALELERIALEDEYFISRKLYPNVDFYSGLIYQAMGFPVEMFAVLFAIARTVGWVAQWEEMLLDPDTKIARPKQIYEGAKTRDYVPIASSLACCGAALRCGAVGQHQRRRPSTAPRRGSTCASRWRSARGRPARRATSRIATTSRRRWRRSASRPPSSRSTAPRRSGPIKMVNLIAHHPRQEHRSHRPGQPLRHQAVSRLALRRRQRRRLEHRRADRAGARASRRARQLPFTIELLFLDGEEAVGRMAGHRQHLRQPLLRRGGAQVRLAEVAARAHPARHDRRSQPDHPPRIELDALADRHHLGRREEARASRSSWTRRWPSKTITCRS